MPRDAPLIPVPGQFVHAIEGEDVRAVIHSAAIVPVDVVRVLRRGAVIVDRVGQRAAPGVVRVDVALTAELLGRLHLQAVVVSREDRRSDIHIEIAGKWTNLIQLLFACRRSETTGTDRVLRESLGKERAWLQRISVYDALEMAAH